MRKERARLLLSHRENHLIYLERARIHVFEGDLCAARSKEGLISEYSIPSLGTACLLLGHGTSLTASAARKAAEDGLLIGFCSQDGGPVFFGSMSSYRPTETCRAFVAAWADEAKRFALASTLMKMRAENATAAWAALGAEDSCSGILERFLDGVGRAKDLNALMGHEGVMARSLYGVCARTFGSQNGFKREKRGAADTLNQMLSAGNALMYGLAGLALWAHGIPTAMSIVHGSTRAGGLVFDLADLLKDAYVMPSAFIASSRGKTVVEFRSEMLATIRKEALLEYMIQVMPEILEVKTKSESKLEDVHIRK